jgi:aspartyl-tRNA(Asn)/glutamyl-tRNA(Gln) amidotransferase subunit B
MKMVKKLSAEVIIGLECHVQLTALKTKLFCSCSSDYRGKDPNTLVCPTCLGLPGSLPVVNREAITLGIKLARALNAKLSDKILFFRKNYYYPDMPKNFQISQYDRLGGIPLAKNGHIMIRTKEGEKKINIGRIHLEEDPARIVYLGSIQTSPYALVDYNRAGITLVEIVTEPDMNSANEAQLFLKKLRSIIEHLEVSDGNLPGTMRCDTNISLKGGKRVEIKNISSFKEVKRAINYEVVRQKQLLKRGVKVKQETRHWDEAKRITISLRTKETEQDYRYFPEPDLVPINIDKDWEKKATKDMPELPDSRRARFIKEYSLPEHDADVLTNSKSLADFYEKAVSISENSKQVSNWVMGDISRNLNELEIEINESKLTPENLVKIIELIDKGVISGKLAKYVIREIIRTGEDPEKLIEKKQLRKITDEREIVIYIKQVFKEFPDAVSDALEDEKAINYLIGQVMKITSGKADPELLNKLMKTELNKIRE